jgi:hypothetical protein
MLLWRGTCCVGPLGLFQPDTCRSTGHVRAFSVMKRGGTLHECCVLAAVFHTVT